MEAEDMPEDVAPIVWEGPEMRTLHDLRISPKQRISDLPADDRMAKEGEVPTFWQTLYISQNKNYQPSHDEVSVAAYYAWLSYGGKMDDPDTDLYWLLNEERLRVLGC